MFRAVPQASIWAATSSQCFTRSGVPPLRLPARHLQARCLASRRDRFSEILDEGAPPSLQPEWASVLSSRRQLALRQPFQRYRAVGVSFGGAQEAVKLLQPGSPLLIQQEPDNEHDAQAVLLCDLAGRRLGYVPRADTDQFPHPLVVGRVESVGANPTSGLWGFQFDTQPGLPAVGLLAPPPALAPLLGLADLGQGAAWDAHRAARLAPGARCFLTGAPATRLLPDWRAWAVRRSLHLAGFLPACAPVHALLSSTAPDAGQVDALAALNQWTEEEGEAYVGHLQRGKQWEGRWSVDVSLLTRERLPTPPGLPLGI
uniref:HIRAN domain-containing protein n=1 Tax=Auxenochlorella protothecoides TaxID=3075 RepID=A0A1D2A7D4_AUXPR